MFQTPSRRFWDNQRMRMVIGLLSLAAAAQTPPEGQRVEFQGKPAIRIQSKPDANSVVPIAGEQFGNGVIEVELAGRPGAGAAQAARGFVGIAFRTQSGEKYECIYLRPTNGRADDQVRRNHSVQYVSEPDWPWMRLRKEFPETYETWADIAPGEWIRYRLEIEGDKARLYLNGAERPSFLVNGLKGAASGGVALWAGPGTEAYFTTPRITKRP
jgi:hypothetical protein